MKKSTLIILCFSAFAGSIFANAITGSNNAEFYYNRGIAQYNSHNYKKAIENFNKAIKLNPNDVDSYNNRGIVKTDMQDYKGANEDFNQALKLNPNFAKAYYNRGNIKSDSQDYKGAIEDLNIAKKLAKEQGDMNLYNNIVQNIEKLKK